MARGGMVTGQTDTCITVAFVSSFELNLKNKVCSCTSKRLSKFDMMH